MIGELAHIFRQVGNRLGHGLHKALKTVCSFLARVFFKSIEITAAYFNPNGDPVYVLGLGLSF